MDRPQLLREEYLTLRKEAENAIAEFVSLERYSVIAIAAIYTWIWTYGLSGSLSTIALAVPILVSIFGALRCRGILEHLRMLGAYIYKIECEVYKADGGVQGWEHFLAEKQRFALKNNSFFIFWSSLIAVTFVIFIYVLML